MSALALAPGSYGDISISTYGLVSLGHNRKPIDGSICESDCWSPNGPLSLDDLRSGCSFFFFCSCTKATKKGIKLKKQGPLGMAYSWEWLLLHPYNVGLPRTVGSFSSFNSLLLGIHSISREF